MNTWRVTQEWKGERAYIIGGGPSVAHTDCSDLPGRIIACNEAGLTVRPDADILFFADRRWHEWNRNRLRLYRGPRLVTVSEIKNAGDARIHRLFRAKVGMNPRTTLSTRTHKLAGWCSGGLAINLAYLLGAREIVLIGFDMNDEGKSNFHQKHKHPPKEGRRAGKFIPGIEAMAPGLRKAGVIVINCTPGSKLTCFPIMSLAQLHGRMAA